MYPTVLALRIRMCMLFTFDFFFSCLSSHFFLSHPQERMHFFHVAVCCPCPFGGYVPLLARVCWVRVVGVRTAQVAHACILLYALLLFVAFFLRLSLEQQQ